MGLGIGLGGFARGLSRGYGLGTLAEEGARTSRNRRAIEAIDSSAQSEFDHAVKSGTQSADGWDDFYRSYVVPKKTVELMKQGDLAGAEVWRTWADSDAARKGGKMFADGLVKAQSGDLEGALNSFMQAAKLKGYGADFENAKLTSLPEGGFRLEMTGAGGPFSKDFTTADEVLQFGASFANPEAAFAASIASAQADAASRRKITEDLMIHEGKAQIDAAKPPSTSDYTNAYKAAAESLPLEADQWPARKRSRWIDKEVNRILRLGDGAGAPEPGKPDGGGKALRFNINTGEVIEVGDGGKGLGNADAKGDALAPTQRSTPAEPPAPVSASEPVGPGPDTDLAGTGPDSSATSMAAVPPAAARPEVAGITGGMQAVSAPPAPAAPGLGGPPQPRRPGHVVRLRQLAAQAATLKPGSPEHAEIIGEINRLKGELDSAAMSGF